MNPFWKLWARLKGGGVKAADDFVSVTESIEPRMPRTRYSYSRDVRGGLDSNVIMSPVNWILRNFTEAEFVMQRRTRGLWDAMEDHPVIELIDQPNSFYDGDLLTKATLVSYTLDGNAYWLKMRNTFGQPVQLWYLPHFLVEPRHDRDGKTFITHYEYTPEWGGTKIDIQPRDIVHFRFGLDPRNVRKGLSPVKPLLREVFTDDEAANFSATILRNMGVPGGVIAPKDGSVLPSSDDVREMKEYMKTAFTGDRRGEWMVLGTPTETSQFGFDPNQLMIGNLRDIAEERVCAALGIPAAVVGFGAGLQQTKVGATMKELRRLAWNSCVEPMGRSMARQLTSALMPDFVSQARRYRMFFDTSMVPAFQEEETEKARRVTLLVEKGVLRVDRAQAMLGLEVDTTQDIYLRPAGSVPTPADMETEPPPVNGNGVRPPEGGEEDDLEKMMARARRALATIERRN